MMKLKLPCVAIILVMTTALPVVAQNLTARQMNIYFGSPKKVTMSNSQGTTVTEFDIVGRVTSTKQGNISISYEWNESGDSVILSMYQGANYQDHTHIKIVENSRLQLKYTIGNMVDMEISFNGNGALEKSVMTTPQMSTSMIYYYKSESDIFPYVIEQKMGNQSMKLSVSINETDFYGNAIVYTQEFMGNKDVTRLTIEYY